MKRFALGLAAASLAMAGIAAPARAADDATMSDAVCILILGDAASRLKDNMGAYAVVMNFQGYYAARIRAAIGPQGDLDAVLVAAAEKVGKLSNDQFKDTGAKCLEGIATDDMGTIYAINGKLGANFDEK